MKKEKQNANIKNLIAAWRERTSSTAETVAGILRAARAWHAKHAVTAHAGIMRMQCEHTVGQRGIGWFQQAVRPQLSPAQKLARACAASAVIRRRERARLHAICALRRGYTDEEYAAAGRAADEASALGIRLCRTLPPHHYLIPVCLGNLTYSPGAKNATAEAIGGAPHRNRTEGVTTWKNGRVVDYTRAQDDSKVRSVAIIQRGGRALTYAYQEPEGERENYTHTLVNGLVWTHDENGVHVAGRGGDYHPTSTELRGGTYHIIEMLDTGIRQRQEIAMLNSIAQAEAVGVFVCLQDSLRAGNCLGGTTAWATKNLPGISLTAHIPAARLLDMVNHDANHDASHDAQRLRMVVRAASQKHKIEMERGYADLADHCVEIK